MIYQADKDEFFQASAIAITLTAGADEEMQDFLVDFCKRIAYTLYEDEGRKDFHIVQKFIKETRHGDNKG